MNPTFEAANLIDLIAKSTPAELDTLDFGVIGMSDDGTVVAYNEVEGVLSGLTPSRVIGRHFFTSVAPCTNNYLIAHRFNTAETLGTTIEYGFTLRMAPTKI